MTGCDDEAYRRSNPLHRLKMCSFWISLSEAHTFYTSVYKMSFCPLYNYAPFEHAFYRILFPTSLVCIHLVVLKVAGA